MSLLFSAICRISLDNHFLFLHSFSSTVQRSKAWGGSKGAEHTGGLCCTCYLFIWFFYLYIFTYLFIYLVYTLWRASLVAQMVKNPPAIQETWIQSLGWEDPLEEGMATHSSILAWRIPWTEEPGGLQSMGLQRVGHDWMTKHSTHRVLARKCTKKKRDPIRESLLCPA